MYSLVRDGDGAGDSGPMSIMLYRFDNRTRLTDFNQRPVVGGVIRVGSISGRTFATQDWWQTSIIEEILSDTEDTVRFKTRNSVYTWTDLNKKENKKNATS